MTPLKRRESKIILTCCVDNNNMRLVLFQYIYCVNSQFPHHFLIAMWLYVVQCVYLESVLKKSPKIFSFENNVCYVELFGVFIFSRSSRTSCSKVKISCKQMDLDNSCHKFFFSNETFLNLTQDMYFLIYA